MHRILTVFAVSLLTFVFIWTQVFIWQGFVSVTVPQCYSGIIQNIDTTYSRYDYQTKSYICHANIEVHIPQINETFKTEMACELNGGPGLDCQVCHQLLHREVFCYRETYGFWNHLSKFVANIRGCYVTTKNDYITFEVCTLLIYGILMGLAGWLYCYRPGPTDFTHLPMQIL